MIPIAVRVALVIGFLYLFLVAIQLLGSSFKDLGEEKAEQVIQQLENPFVGLAAGVLATVMVQSSSVTTSTVVSLVGLGGIPLSVAVPIIMGANIGTTITNTLVSLGHVTRKDEFRRAFAGATVHDFFNLLTVAILFPLELATGVLQWAAHGLASIAPEGVGGKFSSPIKSSVKALAGEIRSWFEQAMQPLFDRGLHTAWLAAPLVLLAVVMIMVSLLFITKNMKKLMANKIEVWLNRVLAMSGWKSVVSTFLGLTIGALITVSVQSSSITTSLLIPMFGAGLLRLEAGFPIMIGANIGTTVTALLAALVGEVEGLTIALVHLFFNLCGTLIFLVLPLTYVLFPVRTLYPLRWLGRLPIRLAERLADLAVKNRLLVIVYVGIVFVGIPATGIFLFPWVADTVIPFLSELFS